MFGTIAFAVTDLRGTLPRKPSSIASRMALLAGSDLCREYAGDHPPDATGEGWLFSLGWWLVSEQHEEQIERTMTEGDADPATPETRLRGRRFGIDIGVPEQLGFRETKWWTLRKRVGARLSKRED